MYYNNGVTCAIEPVRSSATISDFRARRQQLSVRLARPVIGWTSRRWWPSGDTVVVVARKEHADASGFTPSTTVRGTSFNDRRAVRLTRFTYSCLVVAWPENGHGSVVADAANNRHQHRNDSASHQVRERHVGGARPAAVAQRVKVHTHPGRRGRMESHKQDAGTLWSNCGALNNPRSSYVVRLVNYKQI